MSPTVMLQKGVCYLNRWIMLPHRASEAVERLRSIETTLRSAPQAAAVDSAETTAGIPGETYAGYRASDLRVFDHFSHAQPQGAPGFVTDFLGTRTRTSSLWDAVRGLDGQVMGRPVPYDLFEAIEWVGPLKAVISARGPRFAMMELWAGWGPWLAAGAVAARLRNLHDLRLLDIEADPGRFELMRQHLLDNDLDPAAHCLVCAAVGVEAGRARWPKITDPANSGGGRPVREIGATLDEDDAAYMRGAIDDFTEVDIVPLADLLSREPVWDLVHIDVQGWEAKLHAAGWVLENEKPTRLHFDPTKQSIEQMTEVDGAQVWRNAHLVAPFDFT